ncbi:MAG: MotA/TolQ/ExbB proton channel family protein [Pontiellaceae bacterium]|jgi:biopolymer transport protein ExbB/TolQ|nr:MotA/TolQ/ExbB proton channel family protein [Pontiellaceae bacterium]
MNGFLFPALPIASISAAFSQSSFSGKIIVLALFAISIFAWTVMVTKFMELRRARIDSERFLRAYREQARATHLFVKKQRLPESPLNRLYEAGCKTLIAEMALRGIDHNEFLLNDDCPAEKRRMASFQLENIRTVVDCTLADAALDLENLMGLLATAVSTGPFLGLLGTVWGVMDAFGAMATQGSVMLSAVAPGIAGALLTTVVGLLVALPSSIGYNMLTTRIRRLAVQMDNFSQEFSSDVEKQFSALSKPS